MVRMEPLTSLPATDMQPARRNHRWLRQSLGWGVSLFCIAFIFSRINPAELWAALAGFNWEYLLPALLSLAFDYRIRIRRWAVLLRTAVPAVTDTDCAAPFLGSIALNNVLPLRAGDIMRALIFPVAIGVTRTVSTASLLLERIVDLLTLLLCLGAGFFLVGHIEVPAWVRESASVIGLASGTMLAAIILLNRPISYLMDSLSIRLDAAGKSRAAAVFVTLKNLLQGMFAMSRPIVLGRVFGLSFLIWAGEAGVFLALLTGLHLHAGLAAALLVMAIATLSTLAPSSPGYVGPFHLAAFSAVTMLGGTAAQASSFAFLSHLCLWLPTTLAGGIAILTHRQLFKMKGQPIRD